MEITQGRSKVSLSLTTAKRSITIPKDFIGRFFIDIDGKVTEITAKDRAVQFPTARDDSDIGYGWSIK